MAIRLSAKTITFINNITFINKFTIMCHGTHTYENLNNQQNFQAT